MTTQVDPNREDDGLPTWGEHNLHQRIKQRQASSRPMTLRQQLHQKLDFFTEPGQGEKYLKDLEDDLVEIFESQGQEISREARLNMVDYFDQIPSNDLMDWKGLFADTRRLLEEEAELTHQPLENNKEDK